MSESSMVRYRPGVDPEPVDRTDWERVRAMTDEEIEEAARSDLENPPWTDEQLERAEFGRRVRLLRERLGLTQAAFAERFHFSPENVREWEIGGSLPDAVTRAYVAVIDHEPDAVQRALAADDARAA